MAESGRLFAREAIALINELQSKNIREEELRGRVEYLRKIAFSALGEAKLTEGQFRELRGDIMQVRSRRSSRARV